MLLSNVAAQVVEPGDDVFQSRLMDPDARTVAVTVAVASSSSTTGHVKAYRPVLFKRLRQAAGVSEDDYTSSLDFVRDALACLSADSKSGQAFWASKNGLLVVKTIKPYECRNLRGVLDSYADHVLGTGDALHTCISPVLGLYRVTLKSGGRRYFMVSKNVYPPRPVPLRRYDLKGSTVGRRAKAPSPVLKDLDLMASGLALGLGPRARAALLRALERDAVFLRSHGFMDYSLLVAVEPPSDADDAARRFQFGDGDGGSVVSALAQDKGKLVLAGGDGQIYHFGVIDFLQRYTFRKVLETLLKGLVNDAAKISCVAPSLYARRMLSFIAKHTV